MIASSGFVVALVVAATVATVVVAGRGGGVWVCVRYLLVYSSGKAKLTSQHLYTCQEGNKRPNKNVWFTRW